MTLTAALMFLHMANAGEFPVLQAGAPRSTVPILCTDHYQGGRTHARGTGVIIGEQGALLTAAHVVTEHQLYCDLTALVPDNDWSRAHGFQPYSVRDCAQSVELDIAICKLVAMNRNTRPLQAATLRFPFPRVPVLVTVTGFTGWGLSPTARSGALRAGNYFRKQEECYCDFSMELTAFEGMSGGPVTNAEGEVIGVLTALGTGKFRGLAFGISIERALGFLHHHGVDLQDRHNLVPGAR